MLELRVAKNREKEGQREFGIIASEFPKNTFLLTPFEEI